MKVLRWEKAADLCAESGWHGFYLTLDGPMGPQEIAALAPHGHLTWLRGLKQPFYRLQADGFLLRGNQGEAFIKAGLEQMDTALQEQIAQLLEGVA